MLKWQREKPGLPQDEFIDDIPFPETQDYVKKILGRAEDYRYLYSGDSLTVNAPAPRPAARSASPSTASAKAAKATPKKKPAAPAKRKNRKAA